MPTAHVLHCSAPPISAVVTAVARCGRARRPAARAWALVAALSCVAVVGCGKRDASAVAASHDSPAVAPAAPATEGRAMPSEPLAPVQVQRAMRITVESTVRVEAVDAAAAALRGLVERHHGYVASARTSGAGGRDSASFDLRVPAPSVGGFRSQVAELGSLLADTEKAEDVTEQRADIDARVRNARAREKRLLELLSDKTGTLTDVMAVEKELASVRETIERIEAQQRVLEGQIAMATVKVELVGRNVVAPAGAGRRIGDAVGQGLRTAGNFVVGSVIGLLWAGPTLLIVAALAYAAYRLARFSLRRSRARRAARTFDAATAPSAAATPS
jgi:hypothetical protein